jgi:hypothetical protein
VPYLGGSAPSTRKTKLLLKNNRSIGYMHS